MNYWQTSNAPPGDREIILGLVIWEDELQFFAGRWNTEKHVLCDSDGEHHIDYWNRPQWPEELPK